MAAHGAVARARVGTEREGAAEPLPRRRIARRGAVAWHLPPPRACRSIGREGERERKGREKRR